MQKKFKDILINPIIEIFNGYLKLILTEHACLDKMQNIENLIERFMINIAQACFPAEIYYKYILDKSYPAHQIYSLGSKIQKKLLSFML